MLSGKTSCECFRLLVACSFEGTMFSAVKVDTWCSVEASTQTGALMRAEVLMFPHPPKGGPCAALAVTPQ